MLKSFLNIVIIVSSYINLIKVEVEVDKVYYHISVQEIRNRDVTTTLLGFIMKKSKDALLEPLHIFAYGRMMT